MSYIPTGRLLFLSMVLSAVALAVLAGCALNPIPDPTPTPPPPSPTPLPRGGNLTLRIAEDVTDLKPWQPRSRAEEQIASVMYSGLVDLDARLAPQPDLAERWDVSPDGRLITFTLRSNLTWHDGRPLSADDVVYTLGALREISPTNALLGDFRQRIAEVTAPTPTTAVISLTERYAPILSELAVPILPKHLLVGREIDQTNFWDVPVGSGPFQLAERDPGVSITFEANKRFYRGQPLLDRIAMLVAPDPRVAEQALADGRLLLAELPWSATATVTSTAPNLRTGSYAENGYYFLAMNVRAGRPFDDERMRDALALAVDLPALVREATGGVGVPLAGGAAPGSWADFTGAPTATVDLERARTLLDEAGWKLPDSADIRQRDGITLTAEILVRGDDPRRVRAAEIVAEAGEAIGMQLVVQPADFETVIKSKYLPPYDFDLLVGSWSNGAGDPAFSDYAFYDPDDFGLFHSSQINQGVEDTRPVLNIAGYDDPVYDNQADAARQLYDLEQRSQSLRRTQERLADQKPYLFLWADRTLVALNPQIVTLDGPVDLGTPAYLWNVERWYLARN